MGLYPDLDTGLVVVRSVQYVITGAVTVVGLVAMGACLAVIPVGISLWIFDLVKAAGRRVARWVCSQAVLGWVNILLGALVFAAMAAPFILALWWTGGLAVLDFWISAILAVAVLGFLASFPAAVVEAWVSPVLWWWEGRRGRTSYPWSKPAGARAAITLSWTVILAWMYLAWADGLLFVDAPLRLPHPSPAVGSFMVGAGVLISELIVWRVTTLFDGLWSDFYRRSQVAAAPPPAVRVPAATAGTPVRREEPYEWWSPETVVGWRAWRFSEGVLHGMRRPWPEPELKSQCDTCPESPGYHCTCGIYAVKERSNLPAFGLSNVVGKVELSGLVIEHEKGYRAQQARIIELFAPADTIGRQLKERYRCPVRIDSVDFWTSKGLYG